MGLSLGVQCMSEPQGPLSMGTCAEGPSAQSARCQRVHVAT